jgi:hypothetical protein
MASGSHSKAVANGIISFFPQKHIDFSSFGGEIVAEITRRKTSFISFIL